jgi:hypothetical protein
MPSVCVRLAVNPFLSPTELSYETLAMSTNTRSWPSILVQPIWDQLKTVINRRVPDNCREDHVVQRRKDGRNGWWLDFREHGTGPVQSIYLGSDSQLVDQVRRLLRTKNAAFQARFEAGISEAFMEYQRRLLDREQGPAQ